MRILATGFAAAGVCVLALTLTSVSATAHSQPAARPGKVRTAQVASTTSPPAPATDLAATGYAPATVQANDPIVQSYVGAGLSLPLAQRAASVELNTGKFQTDAQTTFGSRYGGEYQTPDGHIVLQLVGTVPSDTTFLSSESVKLGISGWTSLQQVATSAATLTRLQDRVASFMAHTKAKFRWSLYTDTRARNVNLAMNSGGAQEIIRAELARTFRHQALNVAMVPLAYTIAHAKPKAPAARADSGDECLNGEGRTYCNLPLRGGVTMESYNDNYDNPCTLGFYVLSKSDYAPYMLTAGHCFTGRDPSQIWDTSCATACADVHIGTLHRAYESNGGFDDEAIINNSQTSNGWVYVTNSPARVGVQGTVETFRYPILSVSRSGVGNRVCSTGETYNTQCGSIVAVNAINANNGEMTRGLARVNYTIGEGDSGGPAYNSNTGLGILNSDDVYDYSYYVGITTATVDLNVYVAAAH
jgi:hypothetical protein